MSPSKQAQWMAEAAISAFRHSFDKRVPEEFRELLGKLNCDLVLDDSARSLCDRCILLINNVNEADEQEKRKLTFADKKRKIRVLRGNDPEAIQDILEESIRESIGFQELLESILNDAERRFEEQIETLKSDQLNRTIPSQLKNVLSSLQKLVDINQPILVEQLEEIKSLLQLFFVYYRGEQNPYSEKLLDDEENVIEEFLIKDAESVTTKDVADLLGVFRRLENNWQSLSDALLSITERFMRDFFPNALADAENQLKDVAQKQLPHEVEDAVNVLEELNAKVQMSRDISREFIVEAKVKLRVFLNFHDRLPAIDVDRLPKEEIATIEILSKCANFYDCIDQISVALVVLRKQRMRRENVISSCIRGFREKVVGEIRVILSVYVPELKNEYLDLEDLKNLYPKYRSVVENRFWGIYCTHLITYFEKSDCDEETKNRAVQNLKAASQAYFKDRIEDAERYYSNVPALTFFGYKAYPSNVEELRILTAEIQRGDEVDGQSDVREGSQSSDEVKMELFHTSHLYLTHYLVSSLLSTSLFGKKQLPDFTEIFDQVKNESLGDRKELFNSELQKKIKEVGGDSTIFQIAFFLIKIFSSWFYRILYRSADSVIDSLIAFIKKSDGVIDTIAMALLEHNRAWENAKNTHSSWTQLPEIHVRNALNLPAVSRGNYSATKIHKMCLNKLASHIQFIDFSSTIANAQSTLNSWAIDSESYAITRATKRAINTLFLYPALSIVWLVAKIVDKVSSKILQKITSKIIHERGLIEKLLQSVEATNSFSLWNSWVLDQLDEAICSLRRVESPEVRSVNPKKVRINQRKLKRLIEQFTGTVEIYNSIEGHLGWQRLKSFLPIGTFQAKGAEHLARVIEEGIDYLSEEKIDNTLRVIFAGALRPLTSPENNREVVDFWKDYDNRVSILAANGKEAVDIPVPKRVKIEATKFLYKQSGRFLYEAVTSENVARALTNHLFYQFANTA